MKRPLRMELDQTLTVGVWSETDQYLLRADLSLRTKLELLLLSPTEDERYIDRTTTTNRRKIEGRRSRGRITDLTNTTGAKYFQLKTKTDGVVWYSTSHKRRHFGKVNFDGWVDG